MMHLTGKFKRNLRQMFVKIASERGLTGAWMIDASQRPIQVASSYALLGKWVADSGKLDQEDRAQVPGALQALQARPAQAVHSVPPHPRDLCVATSEQCQLQEATA
eukprot:5595466-Amphidinium_carterae.1